MKVLQAYIFFSIKFAGGTSDLMFKLCKALEKKNIYLNIKLAEII